MHTDAKPKAHRIPLIYTAIGGAWIVLSDAFLRGSWPVLEPETIKGLLFVAVTALLLYGLVLGHEKALYRAEERAGAAERLRSLGELAAHITHDFNNVLMTWRTLLPVIGQHIDGTAEASRALSHLKTAECRGKHLTSEIQAFSTPHAPQFERIVLQSWLEQRAQELETTLGPNVHIKFMVKPPALTVEADSEQLQRLLMNLVCNAAEAIGGRGIVTVTACAAGPEQQRVQLSVRDHGPGLSPEVAARVFEPLVTTKRTGTGLGLAIVRRIALDHGGSVFFETRPAVGTTFHVLLPSRHGCGRDWAQSG